MPDRASRNGWRTYRFDEMATMVNDRIDNPVEAGVERYVGLEHLDPDSLTIRRWGSPGDVMATKLLFRKGDVIFGRRRVYQRKLAVADFDGICSAHAMVLRAKAKVALPEFLPFFMQSDLFMERAKAISVGSLSPTINWKTLAKDEFVLPPLEEQRQIADLLLASDSTGQALSRLVTSHESIRQSAIDALTENVRCPEARIGDVCEMQNGRPFPGSQYSSEGVRLLRPGNLGPSGYLSWEPSNTVCLPERWEEEASDFIVRKGDVLINLTAQSLEEGFMGRVCMVRTGDTSLLNQRIGRFCNWGDQVLPEYVFRVLQSSRSQRHAIGMCEGSKVKHLFWPHIARFVIRLPALREQQAVVDALRDVDALLLRVTERTEAHRALHRLLLESTLESAAEVDSAPEARA